MIHMVEMFSTTAPRILGLERKMETITVGTDVPQAVNFVAFLNANGVSAQVGGTLIDSINGVEVKFGTVEYDIFQSRWADFCKNKINSGVDGLPYINYTYRAHKIDDAGLTPTEKLNALKLNALYLESLQRYDGHSIHPGLPICLAREYDALRAKFDGTTRGDGRSIIPEHLRSIAAKNAE